MIVLNLSKTYTENEENNKRTLILTYLKVLNVLNPVKEKHLTEAEIKLLTEFILLPEKYSYQRFSRYAKPVVIYNLQEYHDWSLTQLNLNSKIYELINKEYLWRDTDGVIYIKKWLLEGCDKLLGNPKTAEIVVKLNDFKKD